MRVLIAGGGVAALEALLALRELAGERVEIELLAPHPELEYRPLAVAEPFEVGRQRSYDLAAIAADQGATLRVGGLHEVRTDECQAITREGHALDYDVLLVAVGAKAGIALPGAVTLKGPRYTGRFRALLAELDDGRVKRLAFAVPPGASWGLPLYELALLTARHAAEKALRSVELSLVTPESRPLELFGEAASEAIAKLLEDNGIELHTDRYPAAVEEDGLRLVPPEPPLLRADRVISLPRLSGPRVRGLPCDAEGFIETDRHGRVPGVDGVYAAGDATSFPVKQGGIATQMADAAAEAIAEASGAEVDAQPFRPVLRGLLLTGGRPRYLRTEIAGGRGEGSVAESALWWPPSKIAGRYLSPYLGIHHEELETGGAVPVEVELEAQPARGLRRRAILTGDGRVVRPGA